MTQITILGCGSSDGVPMIGCACKVCKSRNPKNKRTRQSIYIESDKTKLLIDPGPDIRSQALSNKIKSLDRILITHAHADHIGGLQDLRPFCVWSHKTINIFSSEDCIKELEVRFDYLFQGCKIGKDQLMPIIKSNILKLWVKNRIGDIEFIPFIQKHGGGQSLGFLFKNFAYSTDLKTLEPRSLDLLRNTNLWLVDCIGYKRDYHSHLILNDMLSLYEKIQPKRAILIHMSHEIDYKTFKKKLPKNIDLAYDGMKIIL